MAAAAYQFVQELKLKDSEPRWLSLVGRSGTGKTFLAAEILNHARKIQRLMTHESLITPVRKAFWPKLLNQLRDQEYWRVTDLCDANFVLLDEVSIDHDPSGFGRDKLCELLSCRVGKWTVITSNLSLEKLGNIDTRIASRMVRGDSVVIEVTTTDYALRGIRE